MDQRWRRPHPVATLLLIAGVLLACSPAPAAPPAQPAGGVPSAAASGAPPAASGPTSAPPTAPLKAKLGYTTIAAGSAAPWWVAQEAGYFREQGLDVELLLVEPGATLLAALRNGELDATSAGGPSLALGTLQGLETLIIGSTQNVMDAVIYVRPEIRTVEDLRGKTIGVSRLKAITDVAARLGLQKAGLVPDVDVFTRGTGGNAESLAAMETGAAHGASVGMPAAFEAEKRGYRALLNMAEQGIPFINGGIGATKQTLVERQEMIDRTFRAVAQAVARLRSDREYAIQIIGQFSKIDDRELLGATMDFYRPLLQTDLYPDPVATQAVLDAEENPAARTARPADVTDFGPADRLRASGFLDTLPK